MELILGTSGWSYKEWVGSFYRERPRMFTNYSKLFKTTEINSTFYSYPKAGMIRGLYRVSPTGFIFSAKMPRLITHKKRLRLSQGVEDDTERFLDLMRPLAEKLGPILIQLPPSFEYSRDGSAIEEYLEILPPHFEYAVEFRHLSWMRPETWEMLSRHGVAYTIVDEPLLPPETRVTADFAYIRWHGHGARPWYNYDYGPEELRSWVPKVKAVAEKVRRVYGYFNNHFRWQVAQGEDKWGYPGAVKNAIEMMELLDMATDEQREALRRINHWRERHARGEGQRKLDKY